MDYQYEDLNTDEMTPQRRLINDILDPDYYEKTVHPKRNFMEPTRINLSMSLYQILEVVSFFYCLLNQNASLLVYEFQDL